MNSKINFIETKKGYITVTKNLFKPYFFVIYVN